MRLIIELPSGHNMLMCGMYHPPTTNHMESELIAYVSFIIDEFLEANPDGFVICGGHLNRLNIERLVSTSTGMKSLVDFPTRGDSVLDNCLKNYDNVFRRATRSMHKLKQTTRELYCLLE